MSRLTATVRRHGPQLPAAVWTLQAGGLANSFGTGLAFPFVAIYLHSVRGMPLGVVGVVLGVQGLAQLAGCAIAGPAVDRFGARQVLTVALVLQAASWALFPFVHNAWQAAALTALDGIGFAGFWPGQSVLLTRLTPTATRHGAFALQRVTNNLGIGLGGVTGGLIARVAEPGTFTTLFTVDAATFLAFVAIIRLVRDPGLGVHVQTDAAPRASFRLVAHDRVFLRAFVLNAVLVTVGYGLLSLVMPFGKDQAGITERQIGLIWLVNTLAVVVFQMPISRLSEGRRRMLLLVATGGVWAVSWLLVAAGGAWFAATGATVVLAVALAVFGIGECLHGAVFGPLVADLAPEGLQGRYFAVSSMSWGLGMLVGPAVGGVVLGANAFALWPLAAAGCVGLGALAFRTERALPERVRRTPG